MRAQLEVFFQREWQRRSLWQIVLQPLSWLFWLLSATRRQLFSLGIFRTTHARVPVIVIGNISVGGTGKTPVVLALTKMLQAAGMKPGIVTRGYTPSQHNPPPGIVIHVVPSQPIPQWSDEAQLLAERSGAPVMASADRVAAIAALRAKYPQVNVIVSDDGLQHYEMARDIEIAVIDGARGLGNGYLLPAGPLREGAWRLSTVDGIIFNNTNVDADFQAKKAETARQTGTSPIPTFAMIYGDEQFSRLTTTDGKLDIAAFRAHTKHQKIAAIAGIGNPERFFTHLERLGITLDSRHAFADHHAYQPSDLSAITADIILMTEKDAVKCVRFADARLWQMTIEAKLPQAFYDLILEKCRHVARPKVA